MRAITICGTLAAMATIAFAQINADMLRAKYGQPLTAKETVESFNLRPGLVATVEYAGNRQVCKLVLGASPDAATAKTVTAKMVSDALEQIVPTAVRGKKLSGRILRFSGNSIETIEYENILLSESRNGEEPQGITIRFKQPACTELVP